MRYDELTIDFRSLADGGENVLVSASAYGGQQAAQFRAPFDGPKLEELIGSLERHVLRDAPGRRHLATFSTAEQPLPEPPPDAEEIGGRLFGALFDGPGRKTFDKLVANIEDRTGGGEKTGLRLRLVFSARHADLSLTASQPWELLFRPETRDFLARIPCHSLVRHVDVDRPIRPIPVTGPLRVLLLESAPIDLQELDLTQERERIQDALERNPEIEVQRLTARDVGTLRSALRDHGSHVLHFMGHGGFDPTTGEGCLLFEGPDRRSVPIPARGLDDHLKSLPHLGLVVLNACTAGALPRRDGLDPFKGVASALTMAGVPATIAMQLPISDRAAIAFATALYERLAAQDTPETAVGEGRLAILRTDFSTLEWATPVLYSCARNGKVFERAQEKQPKPTTAPARVPTPPRRATPGLLHHLHLGIRSMHGWGPEIETDAHRVLDLTEHFDGRAIRADALWSDRVLPTLRDFLLEAAAEARPLLLDFAAHWSLAFAAGYFLEAMSGLEITVRQRTRGKPLEWSPEVGELPEGPFWQKRPDRPGTAAASGADETHDVAVAIAVSRPVIDDVEHYLLAAEIPVARILDATVHPEPGQHSVRSGTHALHLAHTLDRLIRARTLEERHGTLHLFSAAPNALPFFLGQLARPHGRIQLYEHDFEATEPAKYTPSLRLPIGAG